MNENTEYPDLLLPPFWGNSDLLTLPIDNDEARIIYSYFPLITEENKIILLNPYDETKEVTTLSFGEREQELVNRFRPEGDLGPIIAIMTENSETLSEATQFATNEVRRGLELDGKRGDIISLVTASSITRENLLAIEEVMTFEDRLGVDLGAKELEIVLFVHNAVTE